MAAKDYELVEGCFGNIYIAKKTKNKKLMSQDRRLVEDNEIIAMFEKYLRRRCKEVKDDTIVISNEIGQKIFEAKLLKEE